MTPSKSLGLLAMVALLAGCATATATAMKKADGTLDIVASSSSEDDALEAALDKGLVACKATGQSFVVIDRHSTYRGIDPNLRAAISVASVLTKGAFSSAGRSSTDWQVAVVGKCA
jgi:hypothetical protein